MPPTKSARKDAALLREAAKRGKDVNISKLSRSTQLDLSERVGDPSYIQVSDESDFDEEGDLELGSERAGGQEGGKEVPLQDTSRETIRGNRQKHREDADIHPDKPANKVSRATAHRVKTGQTKKARVNNFIAGLPTINSFFGSFSKKKACNPSAESSHIIPSPLSAPTVYEIESDSDTEPHSDASSVPPLPETRSTSPDLEIYATPAIGPPQVIRVDSDSDSEKDRANSMSDSNAPYPRLRYTWEPLAPTYPPLWPSDGASQCSSVPEHAALTDEMTTPEPDSPCPTTPGGENPADSSDGEMDSGSEPDEKEPDDPTSSKVVHATLERLISAQLKKLRKGRTLLTDPKAIGVLQELEALRKFNDERLSCCKKREALTEAIAKCKPVLRHGLKMKKRKIHPSRDAARRVSYLANKGVCFERRLREAAQSMLNTGELQPNVQGQGAHHASLLNNSEVKSWVRRWVDGLVEERDGGWVGKMRPEKLRRYVTEFLLPKLGIKGSIGITTAVEWFKKLGFTLSKHKKGVFIDGHERPDVVLTRNEYINLMFLEILPYCHTYEGTTELTEIQPSLKPGEKIHYLIYQDECCFHSNDQCDYIWVREGNQPIRDKSRGRIVHVSDYVLAHCGRLALNEEEIAYQMTLPTQPLPPPAPSLLKNQTAKTAPVVATDRTFEQSDEWTPPPPPAPFTAYRLDAFDARRIIYPGANHDPWWDMPQLICQTRNAMDIFDQKYPDGIAVFIFDCSSAHEAFPIDALLAHKMNRGPGGAQPKMHSTVNPSTGKAQSMVFPDDYAGVDKNGKSLAGEAKGMEEICRERGLLNIPQSSVGQSKQKPLVGICGDCRKSQAARDKAAKEAKARMDEIEGSGVESDSRARAVEDDDADDAGRRQDCCMQRILSFQTDFLAEKPLLQIIIERRGHKCLFLPKFHCELNPIEMVWGQAKRYFREHSNGTLPRAKELVPQSLDRVTTDNIRRYIRHCHRYLDAYRQGLNLQQASYAVKKFKSHRRVPASILMDVNIINRGTV